MVEAQEGLEIMKKRFNKEAAQDIKKRLVVTYEVKGVGGGVWQVIFDQGKMEIREGENESSPVVFHFDSPESFVGMLKGELDHTQAYLSKALQIDGPIPLAKKVGEFFKPK